MTFDDIGDGILAQPHLAPDQAIAASLVNEGEHLGRQPVRLWLLAWLSAEPYSARFRGGDAGADALLESPLPVTGYVAAGRLLPITEGDRTFIDWWAEFGIKPEDEERIVDHARFVEHSRQSPSTLRGDRDFLTLSW